MQSSDSPYFFLAVFFVLALLFAVSPLIAAKLWSVWFSPQKPGHDKNATYECGLESKGSAAIQFRSEYYLYAILFLVFDVEVIFLVPFAVAYTQLSLGGAFAMLLFLFLLVEGLAWAWLKGLLAWR